MSKLTKSTFKAFIRKANGNLHISYRSSFDGMTDCVQSTGDKGFHPVQATELHTQHTLGINGLWLVGQSRDYFTAYDDGAYVGIECYNSCGKSIIAVPKTERAAA